ncbi:hypothetical protein DRN98_07235 [Methanosarcinales archaeon]|nr:MAG: hypothetical protein DRN98_07235 [Methanosarcinales archaeon]
MRKLFSIAIIILISAPALAGERWIIEGSGDDVQLRPQYDYDYSRRYKGYIEDDGYIRLRNPYTGDTLRGYIDEDGYGRLRDFNGNTWRVRPK